MAVSIIPAVEPKAHRTVREIADDIDMASYYIGLASELIEDTFGASAHEVVSDKRTRATASIMVETIRSKAEQIDKLNRELMALPNAEVSHG